MNRCHYSELETEEKNHDIRICPRQHSGSKHKRQQPRRAGCSAYRVGCNQIITEAYTGKTVDRPQFTALLSKLQSGDTLVVTKLDRFARSTVEGVQTVRELFTRDVKVHILNIGLIENTLSGNLILTVFLAFAEFERGMILERTQNGKALAKMQPGFREGRPPKYKPAQINHALELLGSGLSYRQVENVTGISKSTLVRAKRRTKCQSEIC